MSVYPCLRQLGLRRLGLRWLWLRWLGVFILLLTTLAGCSTSSSPVEASSSAMARLIAHAEYVHRAAAQHEQIWRDFWSPEQGFILYFRQGPALLYTHSTPLPGGTEVAPHTYLYANGLERLTDSIYLRYPLPETTVTAVVLQSNGQQTAGLLFHEAFHSWQSTHFKQRMETRYVADEAFADSHVRALLQMRREVLKSALAESDVSVKTLSALQPIDEALLESLGDSAVERLYQLELIEGSAELVGLRAQILSLPPSARSIDLRASMIANLEERLNRPEGSVQSASDLRFYAYGTGAASSFLLAQLNANYQQVIASELLDEQILSQTTQSSGLPTLAQTYTDFGYSRWLHWANNEAPAQAKLTLPRFAALTPATLDIAINLHSAAAAAALNVNFSSGTQGFSQPQAGSYMLPEPLSVSVHSTSTSLLIEGAATHLMSPQEDAPVLRLQIKVDSLPALCSHNPDGTRVLSCELDSLNLSWQGVEFEHLSTTSIEQRGQFLHIDVNEH